MSTLKLDTLSNKAGTASVPSDTIVSGTAKAWVHFNGNSVAIRGAFNVSSITDNGTGDYTVNFTISMPDENYSAITNCGYSPANPSTIFSTSVPVNSSSLRINCYSTSGTANDRDFVSAAIFS